MKHLSEQEWIDYYYGEYPNQQQVQQHLAECPECTAMFQELAGDMDALRHAEPVPPPDPSYSEKAWQQLRSSLAPYPPKHNPPIPRAWLSPWSLRLGVGIACAAVIFTAITVTAFYSGRWWEHKQAPQLAATGNSQAGQRIVLFVVGDHLDRTQRLLAEFNNPDQAVADHRLQATARELLTENRLYRQSARRPPSANGDASSDPSLDTILNDLEPVLVELANQPGDLNRAEIIRLRKELDTSGLLLEIRVLRSKVREDAPGDSGAQQPGKA